MDKLRTTEEITADLDAVAAEISVFKKSLASAQENDQANSDLIIALLEEQGALIAGLQANSVAKELELSKLIDQVDQTLLMLGYREVDAAKQTIVVPEDYIAPKVRVIQSGKNLLPSIKVMSDDQAVLNTAKESLVEALSFLEKNGGQTPYVGIVTYNKGGIGSVEVNGLSPYQPNGSKIRKCVNLDQLAVIAIYDCLDRLRQKLIRLQQWEMPFADIIGQLQVDAFADIHQIEKAHPMFARPEEYSVYKNVISNFNRVNIPSFRRNILDSVYTHLLDGITTVSMRLEGAVSHPYSQEEFGHDLNNMVMYAYLFENLLGRMDQTYQSSRQLQSFIETEENSIFDPVVHRDDVIKESRGKDQLISFEQAVSNCSKQIEDLLTTLSGNNVSAEMVLESWRGVHSEETALGTSLRNLQGYFAAQKISSQLSGVVIKGTQLLPDRPRVQLTIDNVNGLDDQALIRRSAKTILSTLHDLSAQVFCFEAVIQGLPVKGTFQSTFGRTPMAWGTIKSNLTRLEGVCFKKGAVADLSGVKLEDIDPNTR